MLDVGWGLIEDWLAVIGTVIGIVIGTVIGVIVSVIWCWLGVGWATKDITFALLVDRYTHLYTYIYCRFPLKTPDKDAGS